LKCALLQKKKKRENKGLNLSKPSYRLSLCSMLDVVVEVADVSDNTLFFACQRNKTSKMKEKKNTTQGS
jgi:hypothetical protein